MSPMRLYLADLSSCINQRDHVQGRARQYCILLTFAKSFVIQLERCGQVSNAASVPEGHRCHTRSVACEAT